MFENRNALKRGATGAAAGDEPDCVRLCAARRDRYIARNVRDDPRKAVATNKRRVGNAISGGTVRWR